MFYVATTTTATTSCDNKKIHSQVLKKENSIEGFRTEGIHDVADGGVEYGKLFRGSSPTETKKKSHSQC